MLGALLLSVIFIVLDVLSVTKVLPQISSVGINPFWKLSFVFKCLTDSVVLDDFKTALDRLRAFKISRLGSFAIDASDIRNKDHHDDVHYANHWQDPPPDNHGGVPASELPPMPPAEDDYTHVHLEKSSKRQSRYENADHIEDEKFSAVRTGSRDRDVEENAIAPVEQYQNAQRETSESHILKKQGSWLEMGRSSSSSELDQEYAQAVREMTIESRPAGKSKGIGIAR